MKLNRIYITLQINFTQLFTGKAKKRHFISNLYLNNGHRHQASLNGSEKGVFKEGRIAGEFGAAGAGTESTADCAFPFRAGYQMDSETRLD